MNYEIAQELEPCPICGRKAYVLHDYDSYDRAAYGWSAGCPRYCRSDGIHGIEIDQWVPASEIPRVGSLLSRQAVIDAWNQWVANWKATHNTVISNEKGR